MDRWKGAEGRIEMGGRVTASGALPHPESPPLTEDWGRTRRGLSGGRRRQGTVLDDATRWQDYKNRTDTPKASTSQRGAQKLEALTENSTLRKEKRDYL